MRRLVLGLVLVMTIATVAWAALRNASAGPGPLDGGALTQAGPLDVGVPLTIGSVLLFNEGTQPAVIERVRLVGVAGSLKLLPIYSRPVPDERGQGLMVGENVFPPTQYPIRPLKELNVVPVSKKFTPEGEPEEGLQLVFGLTVEEVGVARYREVEVSYRVGGRHYQESFDWPVYLCAPKAPYVQGGKECPPPEVDGKFGDGVLG
jgi:hypothetical protein